MNIQQLCDELTILCHQGKALTKVKYISGLEVRNVEGIKMIGDDMAMITSEKASEIHEQGNERK